jgi:hypothetical protein
MTCLLASFDNKWKKAIRIMLQTSSHLILYIEQHKSDKSEENNRNEDGYECDSGLQELLPVLVPGRR